MTQDIVARLERLKAHPEVRSYYQIAKLLQTTYGTIRAWRRSYASPNEASLGKLAELEAELKIGKEDGKP